MLLHVLNAEVVKQTTKYGEKDKCVLATQEYPDKKLSFFVKPGMPVINSGDNIEAEVIPKGEYLNIGEYKIAGGRRTFQQQNTTGTTKETKFNEAWGKCKHGFLLEAYKKGADIDIAEAEAQNWADRSMRDTRVKEVPFI